MSKLQTKVGSSAAHSHFFNSTKKKRLQGLFVGAFFEAFLLLQLLPAFVLGLPPLKGQGAVQHRPGLQTVAKTKQHNRRDGLQPTSD